VAPPVEHRFKPGREWRGNAGGRPKILEEESAKFLEKRDRNGKTNAQKHVENLHKIALSKNKDRVAAYNALKNTAQPPGRAGDTTDVGMVDNDLVKLVLGLISERWDKMAKAREIKS
jgi:hypothetical protein